MGTTTQDPFGRSALHLELRQLIAARGGVIEAEALKTRLPCLSNHPGVLAYCPTTGGRRFERGLIRALSATIERCDEKRTTKTAVRWHLGLDTEGHVEPARERLERACMIADNISHNAYSKDRQDKPRPLLTIALESIEIALDELGRVRRNRPQLLVGGVEIDDIVVIGSCRQGQDVTCETVIEWEADMRPSRPDCEEWPLISSHLRPELAQEAKAARRDFQSFDALDLVFAEALDSPSGGPRRYRIGAAITEYAKWAATANSLDRDISHHHDLVAQLGYPTLRQAWGYTPSCLEDLFESPAPCMIGVCVVVVVKDQIVLLSRQRQHYVAGATPQRSVQPVHFVGEGMTPDDWGHKLSPPHHAAQRGCVEELGLKQNEINLIPTAIVLDTQRWQPLFCYLAVSKLNISQLRVRMVNANDKYETGYGQVAALLPWTARDPGTRALLTGADPAMQLASNHAQAALLFALAYVDGLEQIGLLTNSAD